MLESTRLERPKVPILDRAHNNIGHIKACQAETWTAVWTAWTIYTACLTANSIHKPYVPRRLCLIKEERYVRSRMTLHGNGGSLFVSHLQVLHVVSSGTLQQSFAVERLCTGPSYAT